MATETARQKRQAAKSSWEIGLDAVDPSSGVAPWSDVLRLKGSTIAKRTLAGTLPKGLPELSEGNITEAPATIEAITGVEMVSKTT
ncbi:MAG: hypothetical protein V4531_05230 [Actinomycetota bacterium]